MSDMKIERAKAPFHIITKPVGSSCNLNCEYCFYLEKSHIVQDAGESSQIMSDELLEHFIKSYIETQPEGTSEIDFAWQGGEPTILGRSFFEKVVTLQNKYRRSEMNVHNSIQTNATLITEDFARFFKENNFLIGISIDGPEAIHNHYRKYPDGRGSFKDVMKGYELLVKAGVDVNTLTVVQNHNADFPYEIYDFLCSIDSSYMQFIPVVEHLENRVLERSVTAKQFGNFLNVIFDHWKSKDIGKRFVQHFDLFLGRYLGYPPTLCVHAPACGRAMALEHNGKLYSCDHFVDEDHYLGRITEKSIPEMVDGSFQTDFGWSKSTGFTEECRKCEYLQLCYGGCLRNRLLRSGERKKHNCLCEGYKMFFEHTQPYFRAMAAADRARRPASDFMNFFDLASVGRNDNCPCGSGRKFKNCHGKQV